MPGLVGPPARCAALESGDEVARGAEPELDGLARDVDGARRSALEEYEWMQNFHMPPITLMST